MSAAQAREWQSMKQSQANPHLGTPEGAAFLVEAKRLGQLAECIEALETKLADTARSEREGWAYAKELEAEQVKLNAVVQAVGDWALDLTPINAGDTKLFSVIVAFHDDRMQKSWRQRLPACLNARAVPSTTQLTLGTLIEALKKIPKGASVANLRSPGSYRGYYCDLYFEQEQGTRPAADLLADCLAAMGKTFTGYKGGNYQMDKDTPLWISSYGECGVKLMAVHTDGTIETQSDD